MSALFRPIHAKKWLEYAFQIFLGHARAVVSNREKHAWLPLGADGQIDLDVAAWRTEPDGVANDVPAGASERVRISVFKAYGTRRSQAYGFAKRQCFEVSVSSYFFH